MARISTYEIDPIVTATDKWIGTDITGGITKNFSPIGLASFFNESGVIGISGQVSFKYYATFIGGRPAGSITTTTEPLSFSSLNTFKIHSNSSGLKYTLDIVNTFVGNVVMLANSKDPNIFALYRLVSITEDLLEPGFYDLNIEYINGNGTFQDLDVYNLSYAYSELSSDKNYVHNQSIPESVWNVTHNLNKFASVTITLSTGQVVFADVSYIDKNNLTITFSGATSGSAYIN